MLYFRGFCYRIKCQLVLAFHFIKVVEIPKLHLTIKKKVSACFSKCFTMSYFVLNYIYMTKMLILCDYPCGKEVSDNVYRGKVPDSGKESSQTVQALLSFVVRLQAARPGSLTLNKKHQHPTLKLNCNATHSTTLGLTKTILHCTLPWFQTEVLEEFDGVSFSPCKNWWTKSQRETRTLYLVEEITMKNPTVMNTVEDITVYNPTVMNTVEDITVYNTSSANRLYSRLQGRQSRQGIHPC